MKKVISDESYDDKKRGELTSEFFSFSAILLGVAYDKIYSGFWGFSCLLTGAVMGGNFFVLNGQTTVATIAGIVLTSILQHVLAILLDPVKRITIKQI